MSKFFSHSSWFELISAHLSLSFSKEDEVCHLHTVVSTESSSQSGEGTAASLHQCASCGWCQHRLWAHVLSSHGCRCLSDADAITGIFRSFSFFSKERL